MMQDEVDAVCRSLKKAVIERAMKAELSDHLGHEAREEKPEEQRNHRNGVSGKTVITDERPLRIEVPRDREGSFEPLPQRKALCVLSTTTCQSRPDRHRRL